MLCTTVTEYYSDKNLASITKEEVELMKEQLENLADENKVLKDQCQHVESQLDIALVQVNNIFFKHNLQKTYPNNQFFLTKFLASSVAG